MRKIRLLFVILILSLIAVLSVACSGIGSSANSQNSGSNKLYTYQTNENGLEVSYVLSLDDASTGCTLTRKTRYKSVVYEGEYSLVDGKTYTLSIKSVKGATGEYIPPALSAIKVTLRNNSFYFYEIVNFDENSSTPSGNKDKTKDKEESGSGEEEGPITQTCEHENKVQEQNKPATCTTRGWRGRVTCPDCGEVLQDTIDIPALGHNYIDHVCTRCSDINEEGVYSNRFNVGRTDENGYYSISVCDITLTLTRENMSFHVSEYETMNEHFDVLATMNGGVIRVEYISRRKAAFDLNEMSGFRKQSGTEYVKEGETLRFAEEPREGETVSGEHETNFRRNENTGDGRYVFNGATKIATLIDDTAFELVFGNAEQGIGDSLKQSETGTVTLEFYVQGEKETTRTFTNNYFMPRYRSYLATEYSELEWYIDNEMTTPFNEFDVTVGTYRLYTGFSNKFTFLDHTITPTNYENLETFEAVQNVLFGEQNANCRFDPTKFVFTWKEGEETVTEFTVPSSENKLTANHIYTLVVTTVSGNQTIVVTFNNAEKQGFKSFYALPTDIYGNCETIEDIISAIITETGETELADEKYIFTGTNTAIDVNEKTSYVLYGYFNEDFTTKTVYTDEYIPTETPEGFEFIGFEIANTVHNSLEVLPGGGEAYCVYRKEGVTVLPTVSATGVYTVSKYVYNVLSEENEDIPVLDEENGYEVETIEESTLLSKGLVKYTHNKYGVFEIEPGYLTEKEFTYESVDYVITITEETKATLTIGDNQYESTVVRSSNELVFTVETQIINYVVDLTGGFITINPYVAENAPENGNFGENIESVYYGKSETDYTWLSGAIYDGETPVVPEQIGTGDWIFDPVLKLYSYVDGNENAYYLSVIDNNTLYFSCDPRLLPSCDEPGLPTEEGVDIYKIENKLTFNTEERTYEHSVEGIELTESGIYLLTDGIVFFVENERTDYKYSIEIEEESGDIIDKMEEMSN